MKQKSTPAKTKKPILKLTGTDGNAFAILGAARTSGKKAGFTADQLVDLTNRAMSGDYDNLLRVVGEYFDIR